MNKHAIQSTAITYWSKEDECFIVESPLLNSVIGVGDTPEEAQREFKNILSDAYEAYQAGRMSEKPGRPSKNLTALNCDVQKETRELIKQLAAEKGCSQGEAVEFLLAFHKHFCDGIATLHFAQMNNAILPVTSPSKQEKTLTWEDMFNVDEVTYNTFNCTTPLWQPFFRHGSIPVGTYISEPLGALNSAKNGIRVISNEDIYKALSRMEVAISNLMKRGAGSVEKLYCYEGLAHD